MLPDWRARLPETGQTDGGIKNVPTCVPKPNPYNPPCSSTGGQICSVALFGQHGKLSARAF